MEAKVAVEDYPKYKQWRKASDNYLAAEERFIAVRMAEPSASTWALAKRNRDKALSAFLEIIDELDL